MGNLQGNEYYGLGDVYTVVPSTGKPVGFWGGLAGTLANTAGRLFLDDRNVTARSNGDIASDVVSSNIGSRPDSVRLGVPTSSGTAPFISFGGNQPKTSTTINPLPSSPKPAVAPPVATSTSTTATRRSTVSPTQRKRNNQPAPTTSAPAINSLGSIDPNWALQTVEKPEDTNYGEYTGDPSSRIYASSVSGYVQPSQQQTLGEYTPTTTYGDKNGVYVLGPGQNPPRDWSSATLPELASARINSRMSNTDSGTSLNMANVGHIKTTDQINAAKAPLELGLIDSQIASNRVKTIVDAAKAPYEIGKIEADTNSTNANTNRTNTLLPAELDDKKAEAEYKRGLLKVANDKLSVLKQQVETKLKAAQQKGDTADWKGISSSALEAMKILDSKTELTPEELQMRKNYQDVFNVAFTRQQRSHYVQSGIDLGAIDE